MRSKNKRRLNVATMLALLFFVAVAAVLGTAIGNLQRGADSEGEQALQDAILRAAVVCYASEGYYPPSLEYIEQHYGVQINRENFSVRYEVFAENVLPSVRVASR